MPATIVNVFDCAECGKPLSSSVIQHGWLTHRVGFNAEARVHTICMSKFKARPLDERVQRTKDAR